MFPFISEVPALDITNNIFGNKFIRRPDLTVFNRVQIAYEALCAKIFGLWGTISALAKYGMLQIRVDTCKKSSS